VDWVAIYGARTINWSFAEQPDPNGLIETELIKAGVVTGDQLAHFDDSSPAWQDEIRTDAAIEILKRYKPNLMLVHLLCLDDINHQYGPMSDASLEAMAFLDDRVKQISDTLTSTHRPFTLLIVSDHGFRKTAHAIYPNTLLRQEGLVRDAWVVPDGGIAMVYVTDPNRRAELLPKLGTLFREVEGVEHVYAQEDFGKLGLPSPGQSNQAPDLLIAAKLGNVFASAVPDGKGETHGGTHGYLNSDPQMQAIFMAWGSRIKTGVRLGTISNLDVAPTIAALLGIELTKATGHPLTGILSDVPPSRGKP
jgi:predicted AlkP superfamily pyrophosphatase or phosphodiesterase